MDTRALTYAEMGEALGINPASAKRLANRHKWHKTIGNDGLSRVHVPVERLEAVRDAPEDDAEDAPGVDAKDAPDAVSHDAYGDARALISVLETRIAELQGRVTDLDAEAKAGRVLVAELSAKAGRLDVLEALLEAERRHAAEMKTDRDRLLERALAPQPAGVIGRLKRLLGA